ncbi:hypothetical protein I3843_03G025600 [Carya illinoinensis]|uniref:DUF7906 domain-containing protein n=1 Tax=Carya illinoinensis TaxID=32201 RepID=A0A922JWI5_CARIL|nr:hypothetical protein I3842_03G024200 [Carya illinoinensis]KAG7985439.1 hypothetical protein I3843_03G025600 [Carya illinoinensis]
MPTTAITSLIFVLLLLLTTTSAAQILGLDSFLTQQSRLDPQAINDSFLSLPSSLKKSFSSHFPQPHIPSLISSILSLTLPLSINLRLIGPFSPDAPALLSSFLSSASQPLHHYHVISPFEYQSHSLSIQHSLHLDVSLSPPSLASQLSQSLTSQISATTSSLRSSLLSIPFSSVDSIIKQDFEKEKPINGIYLYLLNLGPQSKPYAYTYSHGDSSPAFPKCLGTIWTGKDRYLWIDLAAGPVDYGPALSGEGLLPRGEFHPLATLHGRPKSQRALYADLASLVWSAYQSVAFKDMVIAVRTRNTQTVSDYNCNGHHVFTQTRELERPLVGSILQSMWGVSPTHLLWSPRHNSTLVDYTWSVGQTPFGPFSEVSSLSFVQKDAARRNVLLTSLNQSITSAVDVLESIAAHGGDRKLLKQNQHVEFIQRWNLFKYKLDKAVSALSHLDFEMALYYLRSSDHDMYAIHDLVYHASKEVEASLVCFKDPPFPWKSVSLSAFGFLAFFYVYAKRDKLFRNKRKQF